MDKLAVKEFLYGGVQELVKNKKFYYHSTVGQNYSYWTDEGKEALQDYLNIFAWKIKEAEEAELRNKAKEMVLEGLKGEKT